MTTADHILDQIDACLGDYSVSDDAMRCAPDLPPARTPRPPQVSVMGADGEWQEIEGVTSVEFHIDTTEFEQQLQAARERILRLHLERAQRMQAAMNTAMTAIAEAIKPAAEAAGRSMAELARGFQHTPEATGCDDCGTPAPRRDRPAWQSPYGPARRRR